MNTPDQTEILYKYQDCFGVEKEKKVGRRTEDIH